jgi:hypothetical protein
MGMRVAAIQRDGPPSVLLSQPLGFCQARTRGRTSTLPAAPARRARLVARYDPAVEQEFIVRRASPALAH